LFGGGFTTERPLEDLGVYGKVMSKRNTAWKLGLDLTTSGQFPMVRLLIE
jgi:hypothetical protein